MLDLREAVDFINKYRRTDADPDLLFIQTCTVCKQDFPSLPADVGLRKSKGIDPKCKICFRDERRVVFREAAKDRRLRKKKEKEKEKD